MQGASSRKSVRGCAFDALALVRLCFRSSVGALALVHLCCCITLVRLCVCMSVGAFALARLCWCIRIVACVFLHALVH